MISLYDTQDHLQIGKPNEEQTCSLNVIAADKGKPFVSGKVLRCL